MSAQKYFFMHIPKTAGVSIYASISPDKYNKHRVSSADAYKKFVEMSQEDRESYEFISGHIKLNIFKKYVKDNRRIFTIFRDPVDRYVSSYNYIMGNADHRQHSMVRKMSFMEFLNYQIDSGETMCLYMGSETSKGAISNLGQLFMYGVYDCLKDFEVEIGNIIDLNKINHRNKTTVEVVKRDEIYSDDVAVLIKEDQDLYDYVKINWRSSLVDNQNA